ncbi:MAG TPA: cytochrome b/b6 domain-containing protein [Burkholderiaceae bacterium]|nr:cytochrome b/b6 domain-containing protein [Burkholderiaceae bacterium]
MTASPPTRIRVWDLPTRLFHWALALAVIGSFVTIKVGGEWMVWHERLGYAVLAMLLFRLAWGVVGGRYARFGAFVRGPGAVIEHLRGVGATHAPGHNPLGALSVLGLLAVLAFQAGSGLFTNDDIAFEGPLARHVSGALSSALTTWHRRNEWVILALVGLHVAAIAWYRFAKRRDLVGPMIVGDATVAGSWPPSRDDAMLRLRALVVAALCAGAVAWLVR